MAPVVTAAALSLPVPTTSCSSLLAAWTERLMARSSIGNSSACSQSAPLSGGRRGLEVDVDDDAAEGEEGDDMDMLDEEVVLDMVEPDHDGAL